MAKRPIGTYDAHRTLRSSYGSIDMRPDEYMLDDMRIARRADVHNANAMKRYHHEQMIARMRKSLDRLKGL